MRKIELQDVIDTHLPIDEVIQRIMDFCNQNQIKIKKVNDKLITGMYGSRLQAHTRGMRAEPSILPVKISINFQGNGNSIELNVLMKEGFIGFPPILLKKKYPLIFARLMNNLKLQFHKKMYIKEHSSKCNNCGKDILYENQRYCEVCGYELLKK